MKVYLVINPYDISQDEVFFRTTVHIASSYDKAIVYVKKNSLNNEMIRVVDVDGEAVSIYEEIKRTIDNSESSGIHTCSYEANDSEKRS